MHRHVRAVGVGRAELLGVVVQFELLEAEGPGGTLLLCREGQLTGDGERMLAPLLLGVAEMHCIRHDEQARVAQLHHPTRAAHVRERLAVGLDAAELAVPPVVGQRLVRALVDRLTKIEPLR